MICTSCGDRFNPKKRGDWVCDSCQNRINKTIVVTTHNPHDSSASLLEKVDVSKVRKVSR